MGEVEDTTNPSSISKKKVKRFWEWAIAAIIFRLVLIFFFPHNLSQLASRPELSTPLTSLRRRKSLFLSPTFSYIKSHLNYIFWCLPFLFFWEIFAVAEGYWLKNQALISPYAGLF